MKRFLLILALVPGPALGQLEAAEPAAEVEPAEIARVRFGDTLATLAQRYGLSIAELLRLNPTLRTGRLVVGARIRVDQPRPDSSTSNLECSKYSRPSVVAACETLNKSSSLETPGSSASAPVAPLLPLWEGTLQPLPPQPSRFDQSLDELVRQGVVFPSERVMVRRGGGGLAPSDLDAFQQVCRGGALSATECRAARRLGGGSTNSPATRRTSTKPLSPREQALLERIRAQSTPTWRRYGQCSYDWSSWHLHPNGARTTTADCGGTAMRWTIAVSCDRLLVATYTTASGWSDWEQPSGPESKFRQGEDEMVASLCANTK